MKFLQTLIDAGVPEVLAKSCAEILARDSKRKPNQGRTGEEQAIVNEALQYLRQGVIDETTIQTNLRCSSSL